MIQRGSVERPQQKQRGGVFSTRATWILVLVAACALLASTSFFSPLLEKASARAMAGGLGAPKQEPGAENSAEIQELAKYAITEHNSKQGTNLKLKKVHKASTQVVAGTMYHLTVEAAPENSDESKLYEAKVVKKLWLNHQSLEHFKEVGSSSSVPNIAPADIGALGTKGPSELRDISTEDPVIQEAAEHALQGLNSKSNSLLSYDLKEIVSAQAEVNDAETQFQLHLKVARGTNEETVKAGLHRTAEGKWTVKSTSVE